MIAFIGSVFSPYYAWARRHPAQGAADPMNHCALNVALYGRGGARWAMTERGRGQLQRDATHLQIGPSALSWQGDTLTIHIDEMTVPWPTRLRGTVRLHADQRYHHPVDLAAGHRWHPIAPLTRVEVDLDQPGLRWSGPGYHDANHGDAPLEHAFRRWDWSRAHLGGERSRVYYDLARSDGSDLHVGLQFERGGSVSTVAAPPLAPLRSTAWRLQRGSRSDVPAAARVRQTLTDAPFYARSVLDAHWLGEPVTVMHESLSLTRFASPWVQAMLPFRMPRTTR